MLEVDVSGLGSRCQCEELQPVYSVRNYTEREGVAHLKRQTLVMFTHLNESEI